MNEQQEKGMISDSGYAVLLSERVGGKELLLAENPQAEEPKRYMIATYEQRAFWGQYSDGVVGDNYNEMAQEFEKRVNTAREEIESELDKRGLPVELFTAEHCVPHNYGQDLKGKVVAIKAESLSPVYRRGSEQLVYVMGGFGANPNARGTAVFCIQLSDGEQTRFNRNDVLGIVKELPDWVKARLTAVKAQNAAEHTKSKKDRGDAR
jgi:hypothetical protein